MTAAEARAFEANQYARDAIDVRRWDDAAKDPGAVTPDLGHFIPLLTALLPA